MSATKLDIEGGKDAVAGATTPATAAKRSPSPATANGPSEGQDGARPNLKPSRDGVEEIQNPKSKIQNQKQHRPTLDTLLKAVQTYNPDADPEPLKKAYAVAEIAHEGQSRATGEPYIAHPL